MVWIVALAITGLFAVGLLWLGLRGRRLDDHPWCRKCKYDLLGSEGPFALCPECGADLTRKRGVRRGRRRRRPVTAAFGAVFLVLVASVVGAAYMLASSNVEWNSSMPVWMLLLEAEWGDDAIAGAALAELLSRQRNGKLSRQERSSVIARALDIQANGAKTWHAAWGEIVEAAVNARSLARDEWTRYARNAAKFDLVVQSPVRKGDALLRKLVMQERIGPEGSFRVLAEHETCNIDGKDLPGSIGCEIEMSVRGTAQQPDIRQPHEWNVTPVHRYRAFPDRTRHDLSPAKVNLEPGTHRFECRWRFSVHEVTPPEWANPGGWPRPGGRLGRFRLPAPDEPDSEIENEESRAVDEWTVCYSADFVVVPPHVETVELVRDQALRDEVKESITVRSCTVRRLSRGDWLSGIVEFDDPPVACAFDLYFQAANERWLLGSVCSSKLGPYGGFQPTICRLRESAVPAGTTDIDVVLVPSRIVAAQNFGATRIWGEPVVIERVPVTWHAVR
jgi:hypothetical protein